MFFGGITNGSSASGAAGAMLSVALNAPAALVVTRTSPLGSSAGAVAAITGIGPMTTVAFASGETFAASDDA